MLGADFHAAWIRAGTPDPSMRTTGREVAEVRRTGQIARQSHGRLAPVGGVAVLRCCTHAAPEGPSVGVCAGRGLLRRVDSGRASTDAGVLVLSLNDFVVGYGEHECG
jgi:hypothetical protein